MLLAFAGLSLACCLAYVGILASLDLRKTGYSVVSHAVSDYAVGPTRPLVTTAIWISVVGALATAGMVWLGLPTISLLPLWAGALMILSLTRAAVVFFPTDLEGAKPTRTGRIHLTLAVINFAIAYTVLQNLDQRLQPLAAWRPVAPLLLALDWVASAGLFLLVLALVFRPLYRYLFGLSERAFLYAQALWFAVASGWLVWLSTR